MNCDVRNYQSSPMSVVVWDGNNPGMHVQWTNGTTTYSNTVSLPSGTRAPDVSVLYDNSLVPHPYIAVVYMEDDPFNANQYDNVVFLLYEYDDANNIISLLTTDNYPCLSWGYATIDADSRGYFAVAWESNHDLHTFAGKLITYVAPKIPVDYGIEKTLNTPSAGGCGTGMTWPDVALYGKNQTSTNNYIYYTYLQCGSIVLTEQTQNFHNIYNGSTVPSIYTSHQFTPPGAGSFTYPRIASNQYFAAGGSGNGALLNEFTIIAALQDVVGGNSYSSILAITSVNDGSNNITYSPYNLNTNAYTASGISDFYITSSGTQYTTVENKTGFYTNDYPVVAYDKDNDHIVLAWSMDYSEGVYPTDFPYGSFAAQVYANPDYDGTNDPSMQTLNGTVCQYNSIDPSVIASTSVGSFLMAVSSHNTNDLLYAWLQSNGTIYTKVVVSGVDPRIQSESKSLNSNISYPNPYNGNYGNIHLKINSNEEYSLTLYNAIGKSVLQSKGTKNHLEGKLSESLSANKSGFYHLKIENSTKEVFRDKISFLN